MIDAYQAVRPLTASERELLNAQLRAATRELGLSLGDRACLALARGLQATAVTADRAWAELAEATGVRIEVIR